MKLIDLKDNQYATKDPNKVGLMGAMGAKIVKYIGKDPKNVIAILEHDNIQAMHDAIYSGDYTDFPGIANIKKFIKFHDDFMDFVRDARINQGGR